MQRQREIFGYAFALAFISSKRERGAIRHLQNPSLALLDVALFGTQGPFAPEGLVNGVTATRRSG
jgi:hypothetical protein